jgi:very-short-patch-repair endonuclease
MTTLITCMVCKTTMKQLTASHLKADGYSCTQYRLKFPDAPFLNEEAANRLGNKSKEGRSAEHQAKLTAGIRKGFKNGRLANKGKLGRKDSPETIERKRRARLGYVHTEETKAKIGAKHKGKTIKPESVALGVANRTRRIEEERGGKGFNHGLTYAPIHGQKLSAIALARSKENWGPKVEAMQEARRGCETSDASRLNYRNGRIKFMRENPQKLRNTGGELQIKAWLDFNAIEYKQQWTIFPFGHPYDFYLPCYNLLIEFDGTHHWDRIWFNVSGLSEEEKIVRLNTQREKDAIQNLQAGKKGYSIIRLQGWTIVGDAPGLSSFEQQLAIQGFKMSQIEKEIEEEDYSSQWFAEYQRLEGTLDQHDFSKVLKVFEFFVVEAGVNGYNETLSLDRDQAVNAFFGYMLARGIESETDKVFHAVDNVTALT